MRWAVLALLPVIASSMRLDPERIAARLRIEQREAEEEGQGGRGRRQLQPKEISIQVTAPLFSSRLFEFGKDAGDTEVPKSLDVGQKVQLTRPLNYYGEDFNTIYVLSNGAIGFDNSARSYKASLFPGGARLIAPFWNRNDLRNGGHVFYREVTRGRVLERGQSEIRYQYDKSVKVTSAVIVTWEKMQPLGANPLPDDNTNTFQAAIFMTDNGTYANFIYSNIGWTQGAEAGFNRGDGSEHYALPTSGTGNIMYLEEYGNTGIPGEWMFQLSNTKVVRCKQGIKGDTCDEECSSGEWGADCASCCHCGSGTCHPLTGECPKECGECWTGSNCQTKKENCRARQSAQCASNAISFTDYDRCGEPIQRCQCLAGFSGDGYKTCIDIDECRNSTICHSKAICTNTPGRFFCQCSDGFSGDGMTSCVASFLFPSEGHQPLPKTKNAKVTWQLKNPLKILGQVQDKLTISTSGLISLSDISSLSKHLDDMHIVGVAPFFAPIDTSRGGSVSIAELNDSQTLTRVTRQIRDSFGEAGFQAKSALIVTYTNVTDGKAKLGNTFQTLLIGGSTARREQQTYVQILYKAMPWGDGAEAGIMTNDVSSSVSLPGSGTQGIGQLAQLSNVKQPGVWMYRIDTVSIRPCPKDSQLPPYCDENQSRKEIADKSRVVEPTEVEANVDKKKEDLTLGRVPIGQPRMITPTFEERPRNPVDVGQPRLIMPTIQQRIPSNLPIDVPVTAAPIAPKTTVRTTRPRPQFESTPHRPLVSIGSEDFNIDPDVFEEAVTFAPFVTVIPEVFTKTQTKQLPDFTIKQISQTTSTVSPTAEATFPTFAISESTAAVETIRNKIEPSSQPSVDQSIENEDDKVGEIVIVPSKESQPIETSTVEKQKETSKKDREEEITVAAEVDEIESDDETTDSERENDVTTATITNNQPIFVFTTSTKAPTPARPSTTTPRQRPVIVTAKPTTASPVEQADSSKAVYIPIGIVASWLILVAVIAVVVCCCRRRASSEPHLQAMYGPTYGVHPTAYALKRGSKHMDSSYEDHLEKAARLSSEMTAYNQPGRLSQYGSYWNLPNSSPSSGPSTRQSPPFDGYTPRYSYPTARY